MPDIPELTVLEALEQGQLVIEMIDTLSDKVRQRAPDFFTSVREGCVSVTQRIRESQRVSFKQGRALINWFTAVKKWTDNDVPR